MDKHAAFEQLYGAHIRLKLTMKSANAPQKGKFY